MRNRLKLFAWCGGGVLAAIALLLGGLYYASQQVPNFYREALALDTQVQQQASREMGTRVTTLYNDVNRPGGWHALFTDEQINGWLAVDFMKNHAHMIPDTIHDPRIAVAPDSITLGVAYSEENLQTVFSLDLEPYLNGPNEIAFRIRKVRAGALPLPMNKVRRTITEIAEQVGLPLRWMHADGAPVAVVTIAPQRDEEDNALWLEKLELHAGEIYVAGRTLPPDHSLPPDPSPSPDRSQQSDKASAGPAAVADGSAQKVNRQR